MPSTPPRIAITSWQEAEHNAAAWMRHWGFADATAKPGGPDGGIDVYSSHAVGQVKYQAAHVGRPALQQLFGARGHDFDKTLIMFTGAGYTPDALDYAEKMNIALFWYALNGEMIPKNHAAARIASSADLLGERSGMTRPGDASAPPPSRADRERSEVAATASTGMWARAWKYFLSFCFLITPFQSFSDPDYYTGALLHDAFAFLFAFIISWFLAFLLFAWARKQRRT